MIEFVYGVPTEDEIAAIVAALAATSHDEPVQLPKSSVWALAARYPDLEIEDLRSVR